MSDSSVSSKEESPSKESILAELEAIAKAVHSALDKTKSGPSPAAAATMAAVKQTVGSGIIGEYKGEAGLYLLRSIVEVPEVPGTFSVEMTFAPKRVSAMDVGFSEKISG